MIDNQTGSAYVIRMPEQDDPSCVDPMFRSSVLGMVQSACDLGGSVTHVHADDCVAVLCTVPANWGDPFHERLHEEELMHEVVSTDEVWSRFHVWYKKTGNPTNDAKPCSIAERLAFLAAQKAAQA